MTGLWASTLTCGWQLSLQLRCLITTQSQISVLWICCGQGASMTAKYNTWSWCVLHMFRLLFLSWLEQPLLEKPSPESLQQSGIWFCEFSNIPPGNSWLWRTRIIINTDWTGRGNKVIRANFCFTNTSQHQPMRDSQSMRRKETEKTKRIHWGQCNVHFSNVLSCFPSYVWAVTEQNCVITS